MKLFFDTNILLDVLAKRDPFYKDSARLWTLAERRQVEASISTLSLNNIYYIIRKASDKHKAHEASIILRNIFDLVAPDQKIVNQAIDAVIDDFEDAVQFYSAIRVQANYLITRNTDDFPKNQIPIMPPDEFLATQIAGEKPDIIEERKTPHT